MAADILTFEDVVAGYGKETILNGLSLHVPRGAITAVIGPNGAGKSTAFKAAFGMLRVRSGTVSFDGAAITNLGPRELIVQRHTSHYASYEANGAAIAARIVEWFDRHLVGGRLVVRSRPRAEEERAT